MPLPGVSSTSETPKRILASDHTIVTSVTVASGEGVLEAGTVLGKVTASGKYAAYDNAASDGTQTAVAILADKVDATSSDQLAPAYIHGVFKESALVGLDAAGKADLKLCLFV